MFYWEIIRVVLFLSAFRFFRERVEVGSIGVRVVKEISGFVLYVVLRILA